ncbi:WAP four-disulfide core domain protein 1 [Trichechus manatus latirostris]|uniref:WAP four-disulfide core domain protein 1 n=1 Tax=Trichechus manatus latirostris TaxID=127582 RepID=A0A2Y9DNN0_TRIMA|nr:WAP four-disulfide core domain protein 1 [Trichechus manatus latirostris]
MPLTSHGMGSGAGKTLRALCFLLLLLRADSAKNLWKRALQARLPEKSRVSSSEMKGACQALRCQADAECPRHKRCCYNGCTYACLEAVLPPPVLDWLVQPKPRWLGGNGWLLDGPEEVLQAEACSTTEDGAEPLLCPTGYKCHILSPGDMAKGIPNRGQCVKQRRQADGQFLQHKLHREYPDGDSKNVAEHGRSQQRHVQ